jgi:deoxyadenosine/deoxycytidine kinase
VFFLLSRFRQQQKVSQLDLFSDRVVSDYMFAKDRIFASVNLEEAEFSLYLKLADLLEPRLARPDLVVYLQASADVLMGRIAKRGRYYERDISRAYLTQLIEAYNEYFFRLREQNALIVNANETDLTREGEDLDHLLEAVEKHTGGTTTYVSRLRDE